MKPIVPNTPNFIDVLLHFFVCSGPHPRQHAPAVKEDIATMISHGVLVQERPGDDNSLCTVTPLGVQWVRRLCNVPLPTEADLEDKCLVHGCTNHKHEGTFIGDLCAPCYALLTSGVLRQHGDTFLFLHYLNEELKK
jgi:hypothetical protein